MKYFFIMNPGSRSGSSQRRIQQLKELIEGKLASAQFILTNSLDDAYHLSVAANRSEYDVVVAVGGDGTINQVINGFYNQEGKRISSAKLGVIYTGTSPDFCRSYRIPTAIRQAVTVLMQNKSQLIPIGKIQMVQSVDPHLAWQPLPEDYPSVVRYFACCANIGIGASLARAANGGLRKIYGDHLGTFLGLLKTLSNYQPGDFVIRADGVEKRINRVTNIAIGKTFYIASGLKVWNELQLDDQRFYTLTVKNLKFAKWFKTIKTMYAGKPFANDGIMNLEYHKIIEIYGNPHCPEIEFDGDPAGFLPCRIESAREPLELICEVES